MPARPRKEAAERATRQGLGTLGLKLRRVLFEASLGALECRSAMHAGRDEPLATG